MLFVLCGRTLEKGHLEGDIFQFKVGLTSAWHADAEHHGRIKKRASRTNF
jgi:hypothetical protein